MMALTSSVGATSSASGSSKRKSMFTSLFSKTSDARTKGTTPGLGEAEDDCLHDERLESADLTAIWRSPSSKVRFPSLTSVSSFYLPCLHPRTFLTSSSTRTKKHY